MQKVIGIFASIFLASCASIEPAQDQNQSSIRGSHKREKLLSTKWSTYIVEKIDNEPQVGMLNTRTIKLKPGIHNISVKAQFTLQTTSIGPYTAKALIPMKFEAAKDYVLDGRVVGPKIHLWINDASNSVRVSDVIACDYQLDSQMKPFFTTIVN